MTTALIIIFNHRYDANLPKLRTIYKNKFSKILFLMPYYDGPDPDVVPVYEASFYFQGFVSQAYKEIKNLNCDYYFFIGDDLILNPDLNENNIVERLNMQNKKVFTSNCTGIIRPGWASWGHWLKIFSAFQYSSSGFNFENYLPSKEEAYSKLNTFTGCKIPYYLPKPLPLKQIFTDKKFFKISLTLVIKTLGLKSIFLFVPFVRNKLIKIPYPCVFGYSDYFMLRNDALKPAADIFSVFATMNLFVEIALPTGIALTFDKTEVSKISDTEYKEGALWSVNEIKNLAEENNYSIKQLFANWQKEKLYYHPVKLSKWSIE